MVEIVTNVLDHIVYLVPSGTLDQASDEFRALGFTVLPGGVHAGGLTANALVTLADGVYFELITFLHPTSLSTQPYYPPNSPERQKREDHRWAKVAPGWIDYAFLGNGSQEERISTLINHRAVKEGSDVECPPEEKGGRTRNDGVQLEWLITAPRNLHVQELLPFFCGDITPRELRVPSSHTRHPSEAVGVAFIRILAMTSSLPVLTKQLTTIIGSHPHQSSETVFTWDLQTIKLQTVKLILGAPSNSDEIQFLKERNTAIYEIGITATNREGTVKTRYGRLTWVPL
ncbi:hypothetical protein AX15_004939 [Amanita polypyramis BW_CC]|nr:hypothetical protein AX15_004939 [Amanita polypyramis BW_CC]